jgi:hypothetical protein
MCNENVRGAEEEKGTKQIIEIMLTEKFLQINIRYKP